MKTFEQLLIIKGGSRDEFRERLDQLTDEEIIELVEEAI